MLLFRSVALGLLGAIAWLLATHASPVTRIQHERELVAVANPAVVPTIIDVAPGLSATQIAQLVRLGPDERVTSVDDHAVTGNEYRRAVTRVGMTDSSVTFMSG